MERVSRSTGVRFSLLSCRNYWTDFLVTKLRLASPFSHPCHRFLVPSGQRHLWWLHLPQFVWKRGSQQDYEMALQPRWWDRNVILLWSRMQNIGSGSCLKMCAEGWTEQPHQVNMHMRTCTHSGSLSFPPPPPLPHSLSLSLSLSLLLYLFQSCTHLHTLTPTPIDTQCVTRKLSVYVVVLHCKDQVEQEMRIPDSLRTPEPLLDHDILCYFFFSFYFLRRPSWKEQPLRVRASAGSHDGGSTQGLHEDIRTWSLSSIQTRPEMWSGKLPWSLVDRLVLVW